ncbi:hypothetical protein BBJ28_00021713 [Nothophytophthora sp. Chile5]|nr:hypothetical protein BBJ28_00021713 [Nothophytophthora sp. Chile5]
MRRLSLTAMPSRRQRASLSSCGKRTSSLRSTFGNFSMLSSASTSASSESLTSLSSSFLGPNSSEDDEELDEEDEDSCCEQGWMYWKRDHDCWLKVYARLRNELLWLSKGADDVVAFVQIAVAGVKPTEIGGICAHGPSGESMELFAYDRHRTRDWLDALYVAATLTRSYEQSVAAEVAPPELPRRELKEVQQVYTGTLVIYNKEKKLAPWKQFWSPKRLRDACRKRLEKFVDRLDSSKR